MGELLETISGGEGREISGFLRRGLDGAALDTSEQPYPTARLTSREHTYYWPEATWGLPGPDIAYLNARPRVEIRQRFLAG